MARRSTTSIFVRAHLYGVLVIGAFVVVLPLAVMRLDRVVPIQISTGFSYAGYPLFALCGCLSYWSFVVLITIGRGTAFPADPPTRFVAAGPYRWVRNPMYIGNLGMILAVSVLWRSPAVMGYFLALCVVADRYVALVEEPKLVERFGPGYEAYRRAVRRWIPRLPATR